MKHIIFETKEQYLTMKQNWATYFNTEARNLDRDEYGTKIRKLTPTHFIFYAILRGKNPYDCIQSCDFETIMGIMMDIRLGKKSTSKFWSERWMNFFSISDEQTKILINIAFEIFDNKKTIETILEEMTVPELMECSL